ncbi:MAG: riboflavin synthase [Planctomycetes bacterium]|nr:riboflavin synthase [Planctomycetota bacterium]
MFTGIIEHVATLARVERRPRGARLAVELGPCAEGTRPGDSIALDGVCLTVTSIDRSVARFDVVSETLARTTMGSRRAGDALNCERALRAGQPLGGHFVQGHVDGVGHVLSKRKVGEGALLVVECGRELAAGMVEKGSVAVDGVSLTLVEVGSDRLSIALVPFTLSHTGLGRKRPGGACNLETDVLGKYVRKLLEGMAGPRGLTRAFLEEHGLR